MYGGKEEEDERTHAYSHVYMPTTHLLIQNLHAYIQTYKLYNPYIPYTPYKPCKPPFDPTTCRDKPTLHTLQPG